MRGLTAVAFGLAVLLCVAAQTASAQPTYPPPSAIRSRTPPPPVCTLALTTWVTRQNVTGQTIEAAQNSDLTFNGLGIFPSVSVARVTLAPCGVRTMHSHSNVDETLYILNGIVSASTAFANGTICEQGALKGGDIYLYPRNLVHSARNPSCTKPATVLGFFTAFDSATANVARGAFNMPGGPFAAYAAADKINSLIAAVNPTTLSFDPLCLARCGLGTTGGQEPV